MPKANMKISSGYKNWGWEKSINRRHSSTKKGNIMSKKLKTSDIQKPNTIDYRWEIRPVPTMLLFLVLGYLNLDLIQSLIGACIFSAFFTLRKIS